MRTREKEASLQREKSTSFLSYLHQMRVQYWCSTSVLHCFDVGLVYETAIKRVSEQKGEEGGALLCALLHPVEWPPQRRRESL